MHRLILYLLLIFCFPLSSAAADYIACSLPLPPHTFPDASGKPDGHAARLLQGVAQRLGWQIEFRYMPWLRVVDEARAGRCDAILTVLKRSDYEAFLVFPERPLQQRANVLVVRRDSGVRFDGDLEAFMRSHTLGLYRDKAVDERFEQLRRAPWARIDLSSTAEQNMQKLLAGRFDAAIENELTAIHEARELGGNAAIEILQPPLNVIPAYVAFPKAGRLAGQARQFDEALAAYMRGAEYKALSERYHGGK